MKMSDKLGNSAQFAFVSSLSVILPRILSFFLKGILIRQVFRVFVGRVFKQTNRNVGAAFLGMIFVRLELLSTTILFCSRELLRRSVTGGFSALEISKSKFC